MGDKLKVVLSGFYYPVAIVRYFQAAFLRRNDVELYTVGPYTGSSIPWANGMFVDCPLPRPDLILAPSSNETVYAEHLERLFPWKPDIWVQVDAAYHLLGKPSCKHVVVGTDPHCINYDYARRTADVFFNMQTPYMKEGDVWLPYAYDIRYHAPLANALEYDFGIIGADNRQGPLYNPRNELVEALRGKGYNVLQKFGLAYDDYREALSRCKVGLNWSTRQDTTARVFETMAMGLALLTNFTPDLDRLEFEAGTDYMGFTNMDEALLCADELINSDYWQDVSVAGHEKVKPHTWDARCQTLLSVLEH